MLEALPVTYTPESRSRRPDRIALARIGPAQVGAEHQGRTRRAQPSHEAVVLRGVGHARAEGRVEGSEGRREVRGRRPSHEHGLAARDRDPVSGLEPGPAHERAVGQRTAGEVELGHERTPAVGGVVEGTGGGREAGACAARHVGVAKGVDRDVLSIRPGEERAVREAAAPGVDLGDVGVGRVVGPVRRRVEGARGGGVVGEAVRRVAGDEGAAISRDREASNVLVARSSQQRAVDEGDRGVDLVDEGVNVLIVVSNAPGVTGKVIGGSDSVGFWVVPVTNACPAASTAIPAPLSVRGAPSSVL